MPICEKINKCKDKDGHKCYGVLSKKADPLVFNAPGTRKIMILTQQPNEGGQAGKANLKITLRNLLEEKKEQHSQNLAADTTGTLVEYFGYKFVESVVNEGKMQGEYYWTHFIKCPFVAGIGLNKVCAEEWIAHEIKEKQPTLIVTFGAWSSNFVLEKAQIRDPWMEYVWERELSPICQGKEIDLDSLRINIPTSDGLGNHATRLFVMPHPSPRSALGRFLNEKLKPGLQSVVRRATMT